MFLVGTEQRKAWKERGPQNSSDLGPVSEMKFLSTTRQAKIAMNRNMIKKNEEVSDEQGNMLTIKNDDLEDERPREDCDVDDAYLLNTKSMETN